MRMGLPKLLTTDQGKEFRNNLDKKMTELLGIKRQFTTPYHPLDTTYMVDNSANPQLSCFLNGETMDSYI